MALPCRQGCRFAGGRRCATVFAGFTTAFRSGGATTFLITGAIAKAGLGAHASAATTTAATTTAATSGSVLEATRTSLATESGALTGKCSARAWSVAGFGRF
ncbi:MAG TPA: hypothetical protein VGF45_16250, partial [Polyangia bacterium]